MRIGLLGPAAGDPDAVRDAVEFLLGDVEVDHAIYLGDDPEVVDALLMHWAEEVFGEPHSDEAFLRRAVDVAESGPPEAIRGLLQRDAWVRSLARIRTLPPTPARAIEMLGDRIVVAVFDKSVLDEEDIANAHLIVYGNSVEAELRRFGARYFLTPGPLDRGQVAVLETEDDEGATVALFETSGLPVWRESLARRGGKVSVTQ